MDSCQYIMAYILTVVIFYVKILITMQGITLLDMTCEKDIWQVQWHIVGHLSEGTSNAKSKMTLRLQDDQVISINSSTIR